jgi:hypothetical protein
VLLVSGNFGTVERDDDWGHFFRRGHLPNDSMLIEERTGNELIKRPGLFSCTDDGGVALCFEQNHRAGRLWDVPPGQRLATLGWMIGIWSIIVLCATLALYWFKRTIAPDRMLTRE